MTNPENTNISESPLNREKIDNVTGANQALGMGEGVMGRRGAGDATLLEGAAAGVGEGSRTLAGEGGGRVRTEPLLPEMITLSTQTVNMQEYVPRREYDALQSRCAKLETRCARSETRCNKLELEVEKIKIATLACYETMSPLQLGELRSANSDILNTELGGVINAGAARAETFNRGRMNIFTDSIQTERPIVRNETVVVEIGDHEQQVTPPAAVVVTTTGVPTVQHENARNQQSNLRQLDRQDRERREKNVIVTGICETNHDGDWEAVHHMLNYLRSQHRERQIVRLVRLGRKRRDGNNIRPLKIIFEHKTAAREILDKSPRLSFNRVFEMISIKRDLTLEQRLNRPQRNNVRAAESWDINQRAGNRLPSYSVENEGRHTRRTVNPNNLVVVANAGNGIEEVRQPPVEDNRFYIQHFYNDGEDVDENTTASSGGEGGMSQGNGWGGRMLGIV